MTEIDLFGDKQENLKNCLKYYKKTEVDLDECVRSIEEWMKTQPHLPEIPMRDCIVSFLLACKFQMEKTKSKLDMYYSVRTMMPEFFDDKNPKLPLMQQVLKEQYYVRLPGLTPEGYRVVMVKFACDPDNFDLYNVVAMRYNSLEILHHKDYALGDILIEDCSAITLKHALKLTPTALKNAFTIYFRSCPSRMVSYHFVNAAPFLNSIYGVVKHLLNPKMGARLHLHKDASTLKQIIPSDSLPIEYGGTKYTFKQLNDVMLKNFKDMESRFDALEELKSDESKRPTPLINDEFLGYYGNFRKIDVD